MKKNLTFAVITVIATLGSAEAFAGCSSGFLADLACQAGIIDQDTAQTLDGAHAAIGNPLDHAAPVIAETIVPGSGAFVQGYQQLQQHSGQIQNQFGSVISQHPQIIRQLPTLGNFCVTPIGTFGGPSNPVGSPCFVPTPQGPVSGYVVM